MKKLISLILCLLLSLGLAACGEMDNTSSGKVSSNNMGSSIVSGVESGMSSVGSKVESTVSDIKSDMMSSK